MAADEARTLDILKDRRRDVIDLSIGKHLGRIVKLMGDGALAEFASVVDAVACAADIQSALGRDAVAGNGGIYVSRQVYDEVNGKLPIAFRSIGIRALKNIERPLEIFSVSRSDDAIRALADQRISFCRAKDGVRIAYATVG